VIGRADDEKQVTGVIRYIVKPLHRIHDSTSQQVNGLTRRSRSSCRANRAVTIIEMLVVIMIILILAALILAVSNYVQTKGARARAETEIAAMSAALESYKADNGIYPSSTDTNSLDPTSDVNSSPPSSGTNKYSKAGLYLYEQLAGVSSGARSQVPSNKSYFSFKPTMLSPKDTSKDIVGIADPFGNLYGYSTSKNPIANPTGYSTAGGYNPTFDLWSAGSTASPTPTPPTGWIKNW
jgi:prepilin-type N-terminal cleavage/methylation domain-containing protein